MATPYGNGQYGEGPYGVGATAVPSLADVGTILNKDPQEIATVYFSELVAQAKACRIEPYTDDLTAALLRRIKRARAMEAIPLGVIQDEAGAIRLGFSDPEIRRLEAPYRRIPLG